MKVSVVIPCRNEVKYIARCLEAVFASDYPLHEVIVVDGLSDDGTRDVLARFPQVRVLDNPARLTPFAFNIGARFATGDVLQRIDARNVVARDYIRLLVEVLQRDSSIGCAGGDYQHTYDTSSGRFISWAMESSFGVGGSNYRVQSSDAFVDTVGVPMYRRALFLELGGFDESLTRNQDDDFSFRLTRAGHRIFYCHSAKTLYVVRASLGRAFMQYFQYGYFKVFVGRKHGTVTTLRQLVPPAFVVFLVVGFVLAIFSDAAFALYLGILSVYLILGARAALRFSSRPFDIARFQLAALTLHLGYGLGYLRGIVDFLILRRSPASSLQRQTT